jgi:hypothetical protein
VDRPSLFLVLIAGCAVAALKDKEKNGALFSSIISAAQRKVKRKTTKGTGSLNESKEEVTSPNGSGGYASRTFSHGDLNESTTTDGKTSVIPTTVTDMEKMTKQPEKVPWFNYSTDKEDFHRRVENFKQETEAMLQMPRNLEISVNNIGNSSVELVNSVADLSFQCPNRRVSVLQPAASTRPRDCRRKHTVLPMYSRER